jgi:hypothetical protein
MYWICDRILVREKTKFKCYEETGKTLISALNSYLTVSVKTPAGM